METRGGFCPWTVAIRPGGSLALTAVYPVFSTIYDYAMDVGQAVRNRRFQPQWTVIEGEPSSPIPPDLATELAAWGYSVSTWAFSTDVQAIQIVNGILAHLRRMKTIGWNLDPGSRDLAVGAVI